MTRDFLTETHPRVLCLGMTAVDYIWQTTNLPRSGIKVRAARFRSEGGGMAATASVAVARLGGRVAFWGRAGDDPEGRLMRDELAGCGVDVTHMRLVAGANSSVSGIFVDDKGERMIANFRGADLPAAPDWLPWSEVVAADAVLADVRWSEGTQALFGKARASGVPTVLDGDVTESGIFEHLLPLTDYAVFSEQGLAAFAGDVDRRTALASVLALGCHAAVVTLGERGLAWVSGEDRGELPAFAVDVVDTTGAGDVFHGAFAFAVGSGADLENALRFSSAVAALKCTRPGGRRGIPSLAAVLDFMVTSSETGRQKPAYW